MLRFRVSNWKDRRKDDALERSINGSVYETEKSWRRCVIVGQLLITFIWSQLMFGAT